MANQIPPFTGNSGKVFDRKSMIIYTLKVR